MDKATTAVWVNPPPRLTCGCPTDSGCDGQHESAYGLADIAPEPDRVWEAPPTDGVPVRVEVTERGHRLIERQKAEGQR